MYTSCWFNYSTVASQSCCKARVFLQNSYNRLPPYPVVLGPDFFSPGDRPLATRWCCLFGWQVTSKAWRDRQKGGTGYDFELVWIGSVENTRVRTSEFHLPAVNPLFFRLFGLVTRIFKALSCLHGRWLQMANMIDVHYQWSWLSIIAFNLKIIHGLVFCTLWSNNLLRMKLRWIQKV